MTGKQAASLWVNQGLFSDHYLRERMGDHAEWAEDAAEPLEKVRHLYGSRRRVIRGANEARTEQEFIRPVLDLLGYHYSVQTSADHQGKRGIPDYALFASETAKADAATVAGEPRAYYARVLAIGEAKSWGRPLDKASVSVVHDNPSFQIVGYLVGTGVTWGILTNGQVWRLYYEKARGRAVTFFEVDLLGLIERGDPLAFHYFWLFFRSSALVPDASGKCFLERVLEGSATYTTRVQDTLKTVVFDRVMPRLAQGFVAWRRDMEGVREESQETLEGIHRATLALLYRLLFLLYAEARGLLPVGQRDYYRYSLSRLRQHLAQGLDNGTRYSERSAQLWSELQALFNILNHGDAALGVPIYNGGLFRPHTEPASPPIQLDNLTIADAYLAPALDMLTRRDDTDLGRRVAIDYKDLEVRHLGSVYEGLLEFRLHIDEDGHVGLVNDRGERRATGSYYTPDYVVDYIITHTLGPLMAERAKWFGELMPEVLSLRKQLKSAVDATRNGLLRERLARAEHQAVEALLDVKVCDPAMGSGHFLVRAVDYLTDQVIHILGKYPERNPVIQMIEQVRASIVESLAKQGLAADLDRLSDTNLLRRLVMKRCIYGVDLNAMAVELAKVGLWLHSFTVGAPLSFLDHHLRCGNSLVGARVHDVRRHMEEKRVSEEVGQYQLFGGPFTRLLDATALMREVAALSDASFTEVERSGEQYDAFSQAILPYKRVLDLWVARHFGVVEAENLLRLYGLDVLAAVTGRAGNLSPQYFAALQQTLALWQDRRFFHWELEFPEVFVELEERCWKENAGFDAVVGNPPYDVLAEKERLEDLSSLMSFVAASAELEPALGGKLDLFRLFTAKAGSLVARQGFVGLIVPMSLLADQQTARLRKHLLDASRLMQIDAFPQKDDPTRRVFREAKLPTCIVVWQHDLPKGRPFRVTIHPGRTIDQVSGMFSCTASDIEAIDSETMPIPLLTCDAEAALLRKLSPGPVLQRMAEVCPTYQGEINETTMSRLLTTNPKAGPRVLRGGNIQRYECIAEAKQGSAKYIDVGAYERSVGGERVEHTRKRRVGYQRNAALDNWRRLIFAPLPTPSYCFDSVSYYIVENEAKGLALLALLNSQLLEWRFRLTSTNNHVSTAEIAALTVPRFLSGLGQGATPHDEGAFRLVATWIDGSGAQQDYGVFLRSELVQWLSKRTDEASGGWQVGNLLGHLATQIVTMNATRYDEASCFLRWLADFTGLPLQDWDLKRTLETYWRQPWERFLKVLGHNAGGMTRDPEARDTITKIRDEWEMSCDRLRPLLARARTTDRLIDFITYLAYGLTEVEVAMVESQLPPRG